MRSPSQENTKLAARYQENTGLAARYQYRACSEVSWIFALSRSVVGVSIVCSTAVTLVVFYFVQILP